MQSPQAVREGTWCWDGQASHGRALTKGDNWTVIVTRKFLKHAKNYNADIILLRRSTFLSKTSDLGNTTWLATVIFLPKLCWSSWLRMCTQVLRHRRRPGALLRLKVHVLPCFLQGYWAFNKRSPLFLSFMVQAQKSYIKQFLFSLECVPNIFVSALPFLVYGLL